MPADDYRLKIWRQPDGKYRGLVTDNWGWEISFPTLELVEVEGGKGFEGSGHLTGKTGAMCDNAS